MKDADRAPGLRGKRDSAVRWDVAADAEPATASESAHSWASVGLVASTASRAKRERRPRTTSLGASPQPVRRAARGESQRLRPQVGYATPARVC